MAATSAGNSSSSSAAQTLQASTRATGNVWLLATSGWLPFLTCLALVRTNVVPPAQAVSAFIAYAALTLSFLGGARWGAELVQSPNAPSPMRLAAAATPSVVGLAALLPYLTQQQSIILLMLCGFAQLAWDVSASKRGEMPAWNARVRTVLTIGGTACSALMLALMP
jgi:hypothetical protein